MNRIAKQIPTSRIKFCKTVDKFDYRKMMNMDEGFTIQPDHQIIKSYEFWNTHQSLFNEQNEHVSDEDLFKYQSIRENIFKENQQYSKDYILNTLLMYLYTFKPNSTKKTLWASFGEMIYHNLEKNLEGSGKICPVCGKRFQPRSSLQRCCGTDCGKIYDIRMKKIKQK